MDITRRRIALSLLALPAGCAIRPLDAVRGRPTEPPSPALPVRAPAPGQSWTYRQLNFFNSQLVDQVRESVETVGDEIVIGRRGVHQQQLPAEIQGPWGMLLRDPVWDSTQNYEQALPLWPAGLETGQVLVRHTHYRLDLGSFRYAVSLHAVARRWETVSVPAGEFQCLRVERTLRQQHQDFSRLETQRHDTLWLAPEIGRWVLRETWGEFRNAGRSPQGSLGLEDHFRWELAAWT
ncbi:MAG: hypothetical protein RJA36_1705 [Pseudomonadota bacterium]|jgi:hypothetical protein